MVGDYVQSGIGLAGSIPPSGRKEVILDTSSLGLNNNKIESASALDTLGNNQSGRYHHGDNDLVFRHHHTPSHMNIKNHDPHLSNHKSPYIRGKHAAGPAVAPTGILLNSIYPKSSIFNAGNELVPAQQFESTIINLNMEKER